MKHSKTGRGFDIITFKDHYGDTCTLQKSSLAFVDAIWFGLQDADPQVLASQARALGVATEETTGWVPYPVPEEVFMSTRMHLTQEMVQDLLPTLQYFARHGELPQ